MTVNGLLTVSVLSSLVIIRVRCTDRCPQLLDIRYADPAVREYAVRCIAQFTDQELEDYLLQLVQTPPAPCAYSYSLS